MADIPASVKKQIADPRPDFDGFVSVIKGESKPDKVVLAELFADQEIMQWFTEEVFSNKWYPASEDKEVMKKHLLCEIEYWYRMGYDYIHVVGGANFETKMIEADDTADLKRDQRSWANMNTGLIQSWDDFERYPWIEPKDEDFWMYEFVARNLPDGMGILACPGWGFLEIPMELLIGYESMSMMMVDQPDLLEAVFEKTAQITLSAYEKAVQIPGIEGFFQGDDMGFRTSTLFSPEFLKKNVLASHKKAVDIAHSNGKIYMLHSCGCIFEIMDYLIDEVGIDAKHSFEDVIMPVEDFYCKYSDRVAVVGGLDVDILGRGSEELVRKRTRQILEVCHQKGRYAFGSGNSIANYCRKENILAMFDEAYRWGK